MPVIKKINFIKSFIFLCLIVLILGVGSYIYRKYILITDTDINAVTIPISQDVPITGYANHYYDRANNCKRIVGWVSDSDFSFKKVISSVQFYDNGELIGDIASDQYWDSTAGNHGFFFNKEFSAGNHNVNVYAKDPDSGIYKELGHSPLNFSCPPSTIVGPSELLQNSCIENGSMKMCFDDLYGGTMSSLYVKNFGNINLIYPTVGASFQVDLRSNDPINLCPGREFVNWGKVWNPTEAGCENCFLVNNNWYHQPSYAWNINKTSTSYSVTSRPRDFQKSNRDASSCVLNSPYTQSGQGDAEDIIIDKKVTAETDYIKMVYDFIHEGSHTHTPLEAEWYRHELPTLYTRDQNNSCYKLSYRDENGVIQTINFICDGSFSKFIKIKNSWLSYINPDDSREKLTIVNRLSNVPSTFVNESLVRQFDPTKKSNQLDFAYYFPITSNMKFTLVSYVLPYYYTDTMASGKKVIDFITDINATPTLDKLVIKNSNNEELKSDDGIYFAFKQPITISTTASSFSGIKNVLFYNVSDSANPVYLGMATNNNGTYNFSLTNGGIGRYIIKAVAEDTWGEKSERSSFIFNIRPAPVSISPNGGIYSSSTYVTIDNPNGPNTQIKYIFCAILAECNSAIPNILYSAPFLAPSNKFIKANVTHTSGLMGGEVISNNYIINTGPTNIGNFYVKYPDPSTGVVSEIAWPTGTDKYIKAGSNITFSIDSITDTDGVSLVELYNTVNNTKIGNATASGSKYSFVYNTIPLNIYRIKAIVTDAVGVKTEKTFADVNIRPDYLTFTPNGGSFTTMPSVTINNPTTNGTGTVIKYAFCTTDCSSVTPSTTYTVPITAQAGKSIKAFVTHTATTLSGGTAISNVFTQQILKVSTPTLSVSGGSYLYDPKNVLNNSSITISTSTSGSTIQYCISSVLSASTCTPYTTYNTPILINKNFRLFAKAIKSGMTDSSEISNIYHILGDINGDNTFTLSGDVIPLIKAISDQTLVSTLMDLDKNNKVDLSDLVILIRFIY